MSEEGDLPGVLEQAIEEDESALPAYEMGATLSNVVRYASQYARKRGEEDRVEQIHEWADTVDAVLAAAADAGDTVYRCEACSYNWFGGDGGGTCPKCNRRAPVKDRFSDRQ